MAISSNGQSFYCADTVKIENCKIQLINSAGVKFSEIDASVAVYWVGPSGEYLLKDNNTQVTFRKNSCLEVPAFNVLGDSLTSWINECRNSFGDITLGDVNVDLTPLINANQDNADSLFALSQCDRGFDNRIGKYSGSSVTFPANTYNGISIIQLAGTIDVIGIDVLSGISDTTSYSSYSFSYYEQCHKLENAITIDATNGAISVTTLQ